MRIINNFFSNNRKFIPLWSTALLALTAYAIGAYFFVGMRNPQVFFNLFRNTSYLLISGVGMTFVILTGGIDLSVSGVVALTTVASAVLLRDGWNAWVVVLLMLAMGMTLGAIMGSFITYLKVQPFIATLAGMWFARGMCFFISDDAVTIDNYTFQILGKTKILIPGLKNSLKVRGIQRLISPFRLLLPLPYWGSQSLLPTIRDLAEPYMPLVVMKAGMNSQPD